MDSKGGLHMKQYELTVLIRPDLESNLEVPLAKVRELVLGAGGSITSEDNWGKKKLQYSIKKEDFAVYVYFEVALPADAPLKISNALNISDDVIRYLLVKVDEKGRKLMAEAKAREASRQTEE